MLWSSSSWPSFATVPMGGQMLIKQTCSKPSMRYVPLPLGSSTECSFAFNLFPIIRKVDFAGDYSAPQRIDSSQQTKTETDDGIYLEECLANTPQVMRADDRMLSHDQEANRYQCQVVQPT